MSRRLLIERTGVKSGEIALFVLYGYHVHHWEGRGYHLSTGEGRGYHLSTGEGRGYHLSTGEGRGYHLSKGKGRGYHSRICIGSSYHLGEIRDTRLSIGVGLEECLYLLRRCLLHKSRGISEDITVRKVKGVNMFMGEEHACRGFVVYIARTQLRGG